MDSKYKGIDEREIKCCSDNKNSIESGISFDFLEDNTPLLRFHFLEYINDKVLTQKTKSMHLNKENISQLINDLKIILKDLK